jgi:methionyl-tRNA formyltransferase
LKSEYLIAKEETFDSLHDNLLEIGKILVTTTIQNIFTGNYSSKKQNETIFLKSAPKLTKENTQINWSNSLSQIVSFINGLNSHPGAWTKIIDKEKESSLKIFKSELEYVNHNYKNNKVLVVNKQIKISHKEGFLILTSLQLPNKKKLSNIQLLNGFTFNKGVLVV